jgi:hypothetical protein
MRTCWRICVGGVSIAAALTACSSTHAGRSNVGTHNESSLTTTPTASTTEPTTTASTSTSLAPSTGTREITYEPFTSDGALDPGLNVTTTLNAESCYEGVAGNTSFRCFVSGGGAYDPCYARPGATSGPVVCPTLPTSSNVVEMNIASLPSPNQSSPEQRAWAFQLQGGKVCVLVAAAWGDLGPFSCQPPFSTAGPPADCHEPQPANPWWSAACQEEQSESSAFVSQSVTTVWT